MHWIRGAQSLRGGAAAGAGVPAEVVAQEASARGIRPGVDPLQRRRAAAKSTSDDGRAAPVHRPARSFRASRIAGPAAAESCPA